MIPPITLHPEIIGVPPPATLDFYIAGGAVWTRIIGKKENIVVESKVPELKDVVAVLRRCVWVCEDGISKLEIVMGS
jgi:hypothetical protein